MRRRGEAMRRSEGEVECGRRRRGNPPSSLHTETTNPKWGAILEEAKRQQASRHNSHRPQHSIDHILNDFKYKLRHLDDEQLAHVALDLDKSVARVIGESASKNKCVTRPCGCSCSNTEIPPPNPAKQIQKTTSKLTSNPPPKSPQMVPLEEYLKIQEKLEKGLSGFEEKFKRLESSRTRLKDENIKLLRELNEKTKKLERTSVKEIELESALTDSDGKVKSLTNRLDQFSLSMQEMSSLLSKFKEDNKKQVLLKEEVEKLNNLLRSEKEEREKLESEHQNLLVEREKDKALLKMKDQEIAGLKNNIQSISELIANNILSNTSKAEIHIPLDESELNLSSSTLKSNDEASLIASSPSHKTPEPYTSWRQLSGISALNAGGDSPKRKRVKKKKGEKKKAEGREGGKEAGDDKEPSMGRLKREIKGIFAAMRESANAEVSGAPNPAASLLTDDMSFNPSGMSSWSEGTLVSLESCPSSLLTEEEVC